MPEKVSVLFVIPAVGVDASIIEETRRGILAQTYPQSLIEVVQVQYMPSAPGGHAAALNAAREGVTGEFVVALEPGVLWGGHKIERQIEQLQAHPNQEGSVHQMTLRGDTGKARALDFAEIRAYGPRIGCFLKLPWGPGAAMLHKDVVGQLGAYRNVEEVLWEYAVRLVNRGHTLGLVEEDLAVWHVDTAVENARSLIPEQVRHPFLKTYLDRTAGPDLFRGNRLVSEPDGQLVLAALYQKNDDLAASHTICQEVGQTTAAPQASYWHGMVHRREPDFSNARGWFGRAEGLGALPDMYQEVARLLQRVLQMPEYGAARDAALAFLRHLQELGNWDSIYFLDLCERCLQEDSPEIRRLLEEVQEVEFNALFDWTYRQAVDAGQ